MSKYLTRLIFIELYIYLKSVSGGHLFTQIFLELLGAKRWSRCRDKQNSSEQKLNPAFSYEGYFVSSNKHREER